MITYSCVLVLSLLVVDIVKPDHHGGGNDNHHNHHHGPSVSHHQECADWVDCRKFYTCTHDGEKLNEQLCDDISERFDSDLGDCTSDYSGSPTCLSDLYSPTGSMETFNNMTFYTVGEGKECVVFNYDIKGIHNTRTKLLCDLIARQGYQVMLPDYFHNEYYDFATMGPQGIYAFMAKHNNPVKLTGDIEERVLPYGESKGCTSYKVIGTCWGTYMVLRFSSYPAVKAGISMHPSHPNMLLAQGVNVTDFLRENVQCPQLYLVAGDDPDSVKTGGEEQRILGDKLTIVEFPDMSHGWTTRGDLTDPNIRAGTLKAMNKMMDFLKNSAAAHLINMTSSVLLIFSAVLCTCLGN